MSFALIPPKEILKTWECNWNGIYKTGTGNREASFLYLIAFVYVLNKKLLTKIAATTTTNRNIKLLKDFE